jgi:hypothetical protein
MLTHAMAAQAHQLNAAALGRHVRLQRDLHVGVVERRIRLRDHRQADRINAQMCAQAYQ